MSNCSYVVINLLSQNGLRMDDRRKRILETIQSAFENNSPSKAVFKFLSDSRIDKKQRVHVIGFGKASFEMYKGTRDYFGESIIYSGIIVPGDSEVDRDYTELEILNGEHPFPGENSIESSKKLIRRLAEIKESDLLILLISGGGSSLFEKIREGYTLDEFNRITRCIMDNEGDIRHLNAIRYLFSDVKGGGLKKFIKTSRIISLIVSDVPGDDVNIIASGPVAEPPNEELIEETLSMYGKKCGFEEKTRKESFVSEYTVQNVIVLNNLNFVNTIEKYLKNHGNNVTNIGSGITGDVESVSKKLYGILKESSGTVKPFYAIGGGETSVEVKGEGKGGRNLELCLRFLLHTSVEDKFVFCSIGTDGIDGTSGAMGGIVDDHTLKFVDKKRIIEFLDKSESLTPLVESGDAIITGRTGNNVSDIFVGYME